VIDELRRDGTAALHQLIAEAADDRSARARLLQSGLPAMLPGTKPEHEILEQLAQMECAGEPAEGMALEVRLLRIPDEPGRRAVALYHEIERRPRSQDVSWYLGQAITSFSKLRAAEQLHDLSERACNGIEPGDLLRDLLKVAQGIEQAHGTASFHADDLADVLARPAPATPWAAQGLIAEGDLGIISGPGGIGKSWIALALGLDLATGRHALGRFEVRRPYRIAVVDLESRPWESDQRLHRIAAGSSLDGEALRGMVQVVRPRLRFDRPEDVRRLIASIRDWRTDFVVLDSFRRLHAGDENRSETVSGLFLDAFDRLRSETGAGVIIVDHTRKPTGEKELDGAETMLRGSTNKRNMVDWHAGIEAREEHLAFIPTKTRHSKLPDRFKLELAGLGDDAPLDGPVALRYVGDLDKASDKVQDAIVALLQDAGVEGLLRGELVGRSGYSQRATDEALRTLKGRTRIRPTPEGKQVRFRLAL